MTLGFLSKLYRMRQIENWHELHGRSLPLSLHLSVSEHIYRKKQKAKLCQTNIFQWEQREHSRALQTAFVLEGICFLYQNAYVLYSTDKLFTSNYYTLPKRLLWENILLSYHQ